MRYEIKDNTVYVYDESDIPFVSQHHHPDLRDWASESEMTDWAENFIANFGVTPDIIDVEEVTPTPALEA